MTGPLNIDTIVPTKYKGLVALIGTGLSFLVPYIIQVEQFLPSPWPAVIGAVLWVLTVSGVVRAPYVPQGAVLAPNTPEVAKAAQQAVTQAAVTQAQVQPPASGGWKPPY